MENKLAEKLHRARIRAQPFTDMNSWILIILGLVIFALRVQFAPGGWINLPVIFTVIQSMGLMLFIAGIQMMISRAFWPILKLSQLIVEVIEEGNSGAGLIILGLLAFNGLSMIASVMWLTSALGAGLTAA